MNRRAPAYGGRPKARRLALLFLLLAGGASVYSFDVSLPDAIPAYKDLSVVLNLEPGLKIEQARFYLLTAQRDIPRYASFNEKDGMWRTTIPSAYLRGEELNYYVQIRTTKGELRRYPERGTKKVRLIPDTTPPSIKVLSPASAGLVRNQEQMVVCKTEDESEIVQYEILYKDRPITKAAMLQGMLSFFITPAKDEPYEAVVEVRLTDAFGNTSSDILGFVLENAAEPPYAAEGDFIGNLDAGYSLGMGEEATAFDLASFFSDITHKLSLDYELGGWTKLKAGPARLQLSASLADSISVLDIPRAYPNSWIADFQNLINLWNPLDFDNEFDYSGEIPRKYYNENKFLARFSLFDPLFSYAFGDQKLSYQKETIKDFRFRGSSVAFNTPFLHMSAAKGLADLGLYQQAWPRNFFGVQAGLSVFDYWWLQANLSFISSLQGRTKDISVTGISPIGVLYDLEDVDPEESLVFGIDMGTKNQLFRLSAGLGFTLYNGDARSPLNKEEFAGDIEDVFGVDISPYIAYADSADSVFPIFDYFPITTGLSAALLNRNLWGITYGGDLEIPEVGFEAWFHKTDGAYKSLGAAVDTGVLDIGGSWEASFADYDIFLGYRWLKDNVPDILFNDILPLFGLGQAMAPSEYDISCISNILDFSLGSPSYGAFGDMLFTYNFEWADTNAKKLAAQIEDDAAARASILGSEFNDASLTHTIGLKWRSGRLKLGDFIATLGAKTEDSFITYTRVDGVETSGTDWAFSYGLDGSIQYDRYKLALSFGQEWKTEASSEMAFAYDLKFTLLKSFFDTLTAALSLDQTFASSSLREYELGGLFTLAKTLGVVDAEARIGFGYKDSLVDDTLDGFKFELTVAGGISL